MAHSRHLWDHHYSSFHYGGSAMDEILFFVTPVVVGILIAARPLTKGQRFVLLASHAGLQSAVGLAGHLDEVASGLVAWGSVVGLYVPPALVAAVICSYGHRPWSRVGIGAATSLILIVGYTLISVLLVALGWFEP